MQATRIIAIRHGETAWNVDTRIQGQLDIPLNAKGEWQATQLAQALAAQDPLHAVYTSDLKRAHQTATAVAVQQGLEAISHPGLRERGFGAFEGKTFAEIEKDLPEDSMRWRKRDPHWMPPNGGESLVVMEQRVRQTLNELAAETHGATHRFVCTWWGDGLVVSHCYAARFASTSHLDAHQHGHQSFVVDTARCVIGGMGGYIALG